MTTLQSFQSEIDQIHAREVNRQRAQAVLDKEKEASAKKGAKPDAKPVVAEAKPTAPSKPPVKPEAKAGKPAVPAVKPAVDESPQPAVSGDQPVSPTLDDPIDVEDDRVATAEEEAAEIIVSISVRRTIFSHQI
jgi:hypothetical protein